MARITRLFGGERGINASVQGTVWQRFFQKFDFLYHRDELEKLALNGACN
jgi:hypothetical protein